MYPSDLVGTWSSKSNRTLTGPGFYDPLNEKLIEPSHTGISYSFTADGHFEEAYYRAVANPTDPKCPSGIMQWQHGKWQMNSTGSLILEPIAVDGRQLMSSPCEFDTSIYTRYNQSETFERYSVYTDPYHNVPRLDLFQFNGAPMQPLYLAFSPPQMLPTTTLNPTNTAGSTASSTSSSKKKRGLDAEVPINWKMNMGEGSNEVVTHINADRLWWIGLSMTGLGGLLYLGPRRMGIHS
ncbi:ROT1-like protein [Polychaeton citri CBS 116435]|uniref:Protein ROT1 n=1 Tax=Polychaeton citri CBS 116435 TaxID=1314669 RepID=A0A9P4QCM2_9PEZI|nr:ROT1-like protein [Polychaeton citri CBS 116435]